MATFFGTGSVVLHCMIAATSDYDILSSITTIFNLYESDGQFDVVAITIVPIAEA